MRAIGISPLCAAIALITSVAGCASNRQPMLQAQRVQAAAKPSPVAGLCKSLDLPPPDLAHAAGYQQFDVSVVDASGQPISGLTRQDFTLSENSRSFAVAYFREHKNHAPVTIALVVDTSGSMVPKLPNVEQSLGNFVQNLNRCDEVILYAFSGQSYLMMPFSTDHQMTAQKMEMFHAYGPTALYDATRTALQSLAVADYPSRTVILITDGIDNASIADKKDVVEQARKEGVRIYAVGIGDPNATGKRETTIGMFVLSRDDPNRVDATSLKELADSSGGRSFIVPAASADGGKAFANAISLISNSIAQGYAIGAVIPADATQSAVTVAVVNRPDAVVRAHRITLTPQLR
jgi:Ca-activated chloride channel homolog